MEGTRLPEQLVFGLDIGTRSIVGTVGYKQNADQFIVVAQCVRYHETRAMLDGQIHDIQRVAETIAEVRRDLEKQLGRKLTQVCIAAAGRVLKTVQVRVDENYGEDEYKDEIITAEAIHSLEMIGIEKAYEKIREETSAEQVNYYCVGYTVIHYYLNDYMITNLEGHKGNRIAAELLATFLPEEVIDGLYAAVEKAGLEVENLTLEPIAAIHVAIPEKFRLLNIALVDVGAGTSDICITKEGTITAYGMIPAAGDAITEILIQKHLVEFDVAEEMKLAASTKKRSITYKDIMGLVNKTTPAKILEETRAKVNEITGQVAKRILELNGGKSVSAVFVVGGGGKLPTFTELLAKHLGLQKERVALRGEEVLGAVTFLTDIKKDPLLVTPIGICLNYYEHKNNFIFVQVNGERIKLYDNSRLTIVDAAMAIGYPNESLFPQRGTPLEFTLQKTKRLVRGEAGEAAAILLNGKSAGINTPIEANDVIEIRESTAGAPASLMIGQLPEYNGTIEFTVNGKCVICPKLILANGSLVTEYHEISNGDDLEIQDYYTLEQLLEFMDILKRDGIQINHVPAKLTDRIYEKFTVDFNLEDTVTLPVLESEPEEDSGEEPEEEPENAQEQESADRKVQTAQPKQESEVPPIELSLFVNGTKVVLKNKKSYIVVDILDFYDFDVTTAKGSRVVVKVNKTPGDFTSPVAEGDFVELYWEA